ncbi:MAG: hypothetical protein ACK5AO_07075 [bacterium]
MITFFVLLPVIVGLFRHKKLDDTYKILLYTCIIGSVTHIVYLLFIKFPPVWNNLFNYTRSLVWYPPFVYVTLSWSAIKKRNQAFFIYIIIYFVSILLEIYVVGLHEIRASLALSFNNFIDVLMLLYCLNVLLFMKMPAKVNLSKILVIVPFLIHTTYMISLDIFMFFIYSDETTAFFKNAYNFILFLGLIANISRAASLWFAPEKEVFI